MTSELKIVINSRNVKKTRFVDYDFKKILFFDKLISEDFLNSFNNNSSYNIIQLSDLLDYFNIDNCKLYKQILNKNLNNNDKYIEYYNKYVIILNLLKDKYYVSYSFLRKHVDYFNGWKMLLKKYNLINEFIKKKKCFYKCKENIIKEKKYKYYKLIKYELYINKKKNDMKKINEQIKTLIKRHENIMKDIYCGNKYDLFELHILYEVQLGVKIEPIDYDSEKDIILDEINSPKKKIKLDNFVNMKDVDMDKNTEIYFASFFDELNETNFFLI
tara:strand:+ start:1973 stop:2791 length:819 start_codon:yes stop_codon:yes gene_type:complete